MSESRWRITLADVSIGDAERAAVDEVLRSGWLSMGPVTERFEDAFAALLGVQEAVAVTNGTAALHLAAAALGLGPGDEVICPSMTFVAAAAGMRHTGAGVQLADSSSLDDFCLDPGEIERLAGPKTKAVLVLHYGGYPAEMDAITAAARDRGLLVIEDAAHAVGATLDGRHCGTIGDAGCFSFFANKNVTTAEGGMVVFRDPEVAARSRRLRSHGMTTLTWDRHRGHAFEYDVLDLGFNYRIDELRAALGLVQLERLPELNAARGRLTQRYAQNIDGGPLERPTFGLRGEPAHHLAPVLAGSREQRDTLRAALRASGVQTSVHYPAIHRFTHYASDGLRLPKAEEIAERVLTLPLHANLSLDDVDEVCAALEEAAKPA